jgi:glycosyltransferase involved in cell wall biosynthesis
VKAVVWSPHDDASAFYRLHHPARVLGVPVVTSVDAIDNADVVITNRPILGWQRAMVEMWAEEGRRVVVDMDDDFDAIPPGHKLYGRHDTANLHRACRAAALVTCSTPALADRYGYDQGVVIRNGIPEFYLSVERAGRRDPRPWIGWYASLASHPHDAPALGDAVAKVIADRPETEFVYVGPDRDVPELSRTLGIPLVHGLGFYSREGLMRVVAEFDVGVVPLDLSPFNEAKSWLKGLEMAAVGVPVIASPTSEYRAMAKAGGCAIALNESEWCRALLDTLEVPDYRRYRTAQGLRFAAEQTIERRADEWRNAWFGA